MIKKLFRNEQLLASDLFSKNLKYFAKMINSKTFKTNEKCKQRNAYQLGISDLTTKNTRTGRRSSAVIASDGSELKKLEFMPRNSKK